jgi:hypothetical protein
MAIAALVAAWLQVRSGPVHEIDAQAWLEGRGVTGRIQAALRPVLLKLWQAAWNAGLKGAGEAAGDFTKIPDPVVADRISRMASKWLQEVTETRLRRIAGILAQGGSATALESSLGALLGSEDDARLIAVTEVTRAMQMAAMEAYRTAGVEKVRWITRSGHPCPACLANEAAGPRYLGEPFPSGSTAPPEHPHCECALIPAESDV